MAQYESSIVVDTVSYLSSLWATILTLFPEVEWRNQMIKSHDMEKLSSNHDILIFAGMYGAKK